ncbi:hypothetical protein CBR_g50164 [Chara braunii]|uniref:Uncharacterized protein n=1 Tax=Chara braunii TaxID=69332 RepID=A0A388M689_CHABU|nr:hypothetical protein CBR_g50164 [Chara braunii]|eukprot:GBG90071.1 hypothetical protein CBR_g50164 [Chara braunii]
MSAGHVSRPRQQATSAGHVSSDMSATRQPIAMPRQQPPPAWSMLTRSQTATMDQKPGETAEAYQARMLVLITEAKQRSDVVADTEKQKAEDVEKARLLAVEQQRQHDEAAAKLPMKNAVNNARRCSVTKELCSLWQRHGEPRPKVANSAAAEDESRYCSPTSRTSWQRALDNRRISIASTTRSSRSTTVYNSWNNGLSPPPSPAPPTPPIASTPWRSTSERSRKAHGHSKRLLNNWSGRSALPTLAQARQHASQFRSSMDEIFGDPMKTDPIPWFRQFELKLELHHTSEAKKHACLYSRSGGVCQAWLDNLLSTHEVVVFALHTKISWADLKAPWHKGF